jgi:hypothetical protein
MKKRWLSIGLLALLGVVALLAAFLEPTHIVRGYLAHEKFYRQRPASYWREVLRSYGVQGTVPEEDRESFGRFPHDEAIPILLEFARDPDPQVRWPAVALLGRVGYRTTSLLDTFVAALSADDPRVRFEAVISLARWGPMARTAIPTLTALLKDPEDQVAHYADLCLWEIDLPAAVEATGWKPFTPQKWQFSVMMPAEPESKQLTDLTGQFPIYTFTAAHGITQHTIGITDYPPEVIAGLTEEERFDASQNAAAFGLGGTLVSQQRIEQHGLKGREFVIEMERAGKRYVARSRAFYSGLRLYHAQAFYCTKYVNLAAVDYFFESFRLMEDTSKNEVGP